MTVIFSINQLVSLMLDGLTGTIQDKLRSAHKVSAYHMMYALNTLSSVYLMVAIVVTGEHRRVVEFLRNRPQVLLNIAVLSISDVIGQV